MKVEKLDKIGTYYEIGIGVDVDTSEDIPSTAYLGGERKVVICKTCNKSLLPRYQDYDILGRQYYKLVMLTPGAFGGWCPDWLMPKDAKDNNFKEIPGSNGVKIRLLSAFVNSYKTVSGWDYKKPGPKASVRLVPEGSVYVIELAEHLEKSEDFLRFMWGRSLCLDENGKLTQDGKNGYGNCLVAACDVDSNNERCE